ncbi:MAG: DUF1850 domain-containing protein [Desulfomonile sp.]|nr:DUF1850 domain-containing protein [Desulfomonile sp.]
MAVLCYPVAALTVRPARGWFPLWTVRARAGAELRLTWIHTVSRRPVAETFTIDQDGSICLREMAFDHEGPNLPSGPEDGTNWRIEEGRVVVTGYRRCFDQLNFAVSPLGHWLERDTRCWNLVADAGPDCQFRVTCQRIPLILIVWAEVLQWRHSMSKL